MISTVASASMAVTASAISSKASGPMMWTPRISPNFSSETTLTKPSWWPRMVALLLASEGELADLHLVALGVRLGFGEADAADAGLGVGGAGNAVR